MEVVQDRVGAGPASGQNFISGQGQREPVGEVEGPLHLIKRIIVVDADLHQLGLRLGLGGDELSDPASWLEETIGLPSRWLRRGLLFLSYLILAVAGESGGSVEAKQNGKGFTFAAGICIGRAFRPPFSDGRCARAV